MNTKFCTCGAILTAEESEFYEIMCEDCELENMARIARWIDGEDDEELDEAYGDTDERYSAGRAH